MKVGITLDNKLLEFIDNYAKAIFMSRSGFISLACTQFLKLTNDTSNSISVLNISEKK